MFVKAIAFRDVRRGDMVSENADCGWYEIGRCETLPTGMVRLHIAGGGCLEGPAGQLIGLFHRPWPEAMLSESNPLGYAQAATLEALAVLGFSDSREWGDLDNRLGMVLRAIEAYELGKPVPGKKVGSRWEPVSTEPDLTAGGC
ncbi:MAG: hypothetical protein IT405_03080 [Candidatus Yanofskybacteria bacterium]|nr:hypothetical protein [Candidatus Yanofskybacteria bacterium]